MVEYICKWFVRIESIGVLQEPHVCRAAHADVCSPVSNVAEATVAREAEQRTAKEMRSEVIRMTDVWSLKDYSSMKECSVERRYRGGPAWSALQKRPAFYALASNAIPEASPALTTHREMKWASRHKVSGRSWQGYSICGGYEFLGNRW